MAYHRQWHITGWRAVLLAPIAIPAVLLIKLTERLFGLKTTADLTARDVEAYLHNFLYGGGGEWDWDDFTSIRITDPRLDRIRREAAILEPPLDDADEARLRELLSEVQTL